MDEPALPARRVSTEDRRKRQRPHPRALAAGRRERGHVAPRVGRKIQSPGRGLSPPSESSREMGSPGGLAARQDNGTRARPRELADEKAAVEQIDALPRTTRL